MSGAADCASRSPSLCSIGFNAAAPISLISVTSHTDVDLLSCVASSKLLKFSQYIFVCAFDRVRYVQLTCLLGTEVSALDRLISMGAFGHLATTINGADVGVQLSAVQSLFSMIIQRQHKGEEDTPPDSYGRQAEKHAATSELFDDSDSLHHDIHAFLRQRNEASHIRKFRKCLASQLVPTLFFQVVATQRHQWDSYAHCLLTKLCLDVFAETALTRDACDIISRLKVSAASVDHHKVVNNPARTNTTSTFLLFELLARCISALRSDSQTCADQRVAQSEWDLVNPAIYHSPNSFPSYYAS